MRKITKPKSLAEYATATRRKSCKLCALPTAVQAQLAQNDTKTIPVPIVLAWLKDEHGITISQREYITHGRGGHGWAVDGSGARVLSKRARSRPASP